MVRRRVTFVTWLNRTAISMHEQHKIDEARYFLGQLRALVNERNAFNYNLSAFLAAARSALQYAHKEVQNDPNGRAWYDGQISGKPVVRFFRDKRDISIHANPIKPSAKISVSVTDRLVLSDSFSATIHRKDGSTETVVSQPPPPTPPTPDENESTAEYEYVFQDWSGNEDVVTLCEQYMIEVEALVALKTGNGYPS